MRNEIIGFSGTKASPGMNLDDNGLVVYGTWFADYDNGLPVGEPRFMPNTIQPGMVEGAASAPDDEFPSELAGAALATAVAVVCAVIIIGVSIYAGLYL